MDQLNQKFRVLQRPINKIPFKYNIAKSQSLTRKKNNESNLKLPNINFQPKNQAKQIIFIQDKLKLVTAIAKELNFQNKKVSCISEQVLKKIKQDTKSIPYNSSIYQDQIILLNKIFQNIGIHLKAKDVLILLGKHSQTTYTFFTNYPRHPLTICCKSEIIIKHMHFLSPMYQKSLHKLQTINNKPLKNLIVIACLQCEKSIIKIRNQKKQQQFQHGLSEFQQKKKLIHYSKLIASGKFKKNLIREQSSTVLIKHSLSKSILNNNQSNLINKPQFFINKPSYLINKPSYLISKPLQQKADHYQNALLKLKNQQMSLDLIKNRNNNKQSDRIKLHQKISESQRYKQSNTFC